MCVRWGQACILVFLSKYASLTPSKMKPRDGRPGDLPAKNVSSCHSWQRPGIHRYASHRVVIPSSCHCWRRPGIHRYTSHRIVIAGADQESTAMPLIELSLHRVVIAGADQESTGLAIQGDSWIPGLRQE